MGYCNSLRTLELAGAGVGTVTEAEFVHLRDHSLGPALSLGTSLRKQSERADAGSDEQHRRSVLTGSNASAATYAGCCIHTLLSFVVGNKQNVCILSGAGTYGDESSSLEYLIERTTIDYEILDNGECGTAERLYCNSSTVLEVAHKELTGCNVVVRTVGTAVDIQRTSSADTLTAVVVERNRTAALASSLYSYRVATFPDKLLIEDIEHLEERGVLLDTADVVGLEMAFCLGVFLTPYLKIEFHRTESL